MTRINRTFVHAAVAASLALFTGCTPLARPAPGFVALDEQAPYDFRAVAPDGVVIGARVVTIGDQGDLAFWSRAVTLRMRQLNGYALLGESDVRSRDGVQGKELSFGHDEQGKPYEYRIRIFVGDKRFLASRKLFVAEAGGAKELMDRYRASVDWTFTSLDVD